MNSKIKDESVDFLFQAILSLKTVDECYNFFEDLCTVPEIKAMSTAAFGGSYAEYKKVYSDIVAITGASHCHDQPRESIPELWLRWV